MNLPRKNSFAWLLATLGVSFGALPVLPAHADDYSWAQGGDGSFQDPENWLCFCGGLIPGPSDTAIFDLSSAGYTVTFDASATNLGLQIGDDIVTLDLNGNDYTISDLFQLTTDAADQADLTIENGALNVLSSTDMNGTGGGTADLTVQGSGTALSLSGDVSLGTTAAASLAIDTGGVVDDTNPDPFDVGPFGTVTVDNTSTLRTGGSVTPGGTTRIGTGAGGTAGLTVTGNGVWEYYGDVDVGVDGPGQVTIDFGGVALAQALSVFRVGQDGQLDLTDGSILVAGDTVLGSGAGGTAVATVVGGDGFNTVWNNSGSMSIGEAGPATPTWARPGRARSA